MYIEVLPAPPDQQSILANLLEFYAYDFSEFHSLELGSNGLFGYKNLPLYWNERGRHPFLIKVDGGLAGLALVKRGSEFSNNADAWDVAEFFIMRAYRRRGIGMAVAHEIWRKFPGPWEVRVMESNGAAVKFWQRAITTFTGRPIEPAPIEKDGKCWYVFVFECKHAR